MILYLLLIYSKKVRSNNKLNNLLILASSFLNQDSNISLQALSCPGFVIKLSMNKFRIKRKKDKFQLLNLKKKIHLIRRHHITFISLIIRIYFSKSIFKKFSLGKNSLKKILDFRRKRSTRFNVWFFKTLRI